MISLLYLSLSVLCAAALLIVAIRYSGIFLGKPLRLDEPLPLTPLQKRAWLGLVIGGVTTAALLVLFLFRPFLDFEKDPVTRFVAFGILAIGGLLWWATTRLVPRFSGTAVLDERDRLALGRAPTVQASLMFLAVAAWTVGLTHVYWDRGAVPIVFLVAIFWSTFIAYLLGLALGTLWAYRSEPHHAEG